ncbi:GNAT family N-acetyltransferase [bacterium]|nr:GNAT family N-acetyltransferase [bacterium]
MKNYIIRELKKEDLEEKYFFETLSNLKYCKDISLDLAKDIFDYCERSNIKHYVLEQNKIIVACIRVVFEPKFYHQGREAAHIEDVATHPDYQGNGFSSILINEIIAKAKDRNVYKIILNCSNDLIPFYKRFGFKVKDNSLRLDF